MTRTSYKDTRTEVNHTPLQSHYILLPCIIVLAAFLFFYRLGAYSLWDSDEPMYAEVAKAMADRHDLITPYWNGSPWFIHPPLYFWCTVAVAHWIGWNEMSTRFTSALFAVALTILTYCFSFTLFSNRKSALLSSMIHITALQVFAQGRMVLLDLPFNFFVVMGMLLFYKNYWNPRTIYSLGFWVCCGIATFFKGPLGLFQPLGTCLVFLFILHEFKKIGQLHPGWGFLIYLLIASPWYIILSFMYGKDFYDPVIGYYILKRIVSPIHGQSGPWYYYFPVLIGGFFPWSPFLPFLAIEWINNRRNRPVLFLLLWVVLSFLFFSTAGTKLPNYIYILYVPLSIGLAQYFLTHIKKLKPILLGHILLLFLVALVVATFYLFGNNALGEEYLFLKPMIQLLLAIIMLAPAVSLIFFIISIRSFPYVLIISAFILYIVLVHTIIKLDAAKPMKPFAIAIRTHMQAHDKIAVSAGVPGTNSLIFYIGAPVKYCCEKWEKKLLLDSPEGYFYIARESEFPQLQWYAKRALYILRRQGGYILITNKVKCDINN